MGVDPKTTIAKDLSSRPRAKGQLPQRTLGEPYMAAKLYGLNAWLPIDSECDTWNIGDMEKDFAFSARRPEQAWLVRKTSRSTSLEMLSTEPGFDRPSASLRSWNDVTASESRWTMALDVK